MKLDSRKAINEETIHGRLTAQERMFLWRTRNGLSQPAAAKKAKVSLALWRDWEWGLADPPKQFQISGSAEPYEMAMIWRRRNHLSRVMMAKMYGTSHITLRELERGNGDWQKLVAWWRDHA